MSCSVHRQRRGSTFLSLPEGTSKRPRWRSPTTSDHHQSVDAAIKSDSRRAREHRPQSEPANDATWKPATYSTDATVGSWARCAWRPPASIGGSAVEAAPHSTSDPHRRSGTPARCPRVDTPPTSGTANAVRQRRRQDTTEACGPDPAAGPAHTSSRPAMQNAASSQASRGPLARDDVAADHDDVR